MTIYGNVDLSVQHLRSGDDAPLAGDHLTRLADGTLYGPGSRLGFRVIEDLGGGLKAGALLENGFFADSGQLAQGGRAFGRQVYIWIANQLGELRMGRQYMLDDEVLPFTSPVGGLTVLNPGSPYTYKPGLMPIFIDPNRIDNAVHYLSPFFGGFRAQAMYALGEKTVDRYHAVKALYESGPIHVAAAYEWSKAQTVPPGGDSDVNKLFQVGANYDFGVFRLYGGYQQVKDLTTGIGTQVGTLDLPGLDGPASKMKSYTTGASIPVWRHHLRRQLRLRQVQQRLGCGHQRQSVRCRCHLRVLQDNLRLRHGCAGGWRLAQRHQREADLPAWAAQVVLKSAGMQAIPPLR